MARRALDWSTSPQGIRLIGLAVALALVGALTAHTWGFRLEDTLVYARYARNFGDGDGLVFNHGEHRNGTPSYAYPLLLGLPALAGVTVLPQTAALITALSIAATCAILVLRLAPDRSAWGGLMAVGGAIAYAALSLNYHSLGAEIAPALLALTAGLALVSRRPLVGGLAVGLAVALRPELVAFAVPIAIGVTLRDRRAGASLAGGFAAALVPWVAFSTLYYGSPLPDWYSARLDQSASGFFGPDNLFSFSAQELLRDLYVPWKALVFVGSVALLLAAFHSAAGRLRLRHRFVPRPERAARDLVWQILAGVALYVVLGATLDIQAQAPVLVPLVWGLAAGLPAAAFVGARSASDVNYRGEPLIRAMAVALVGIATLASLVSLSGLPTGRDESATDVALWLRDNGGDDCAVGTTEPGYLGWYAPDCRVVDTNGLLSDGVAAALADGNLRSWLVSEPPRFVMINAPYFGHEKGAVQALLGGTYELLTTPRPAGRLVMARTAAGREAGSLLGGDIGGGSPNLNENIYSVRGVARPGLFMHAAGSYTLQITPKAGDAFEVGLGMADGADRSAGVTFEATMRVAGEPEVMILREVVRPGTEWREVLVPIPPEFEGKTAELTLSTDTAPGGTTDFGWAIWGAPRVGQPNR